MKKIFLLGLIGFLLTGCNQVIEECMITYELRNRTEYNVTIIDTSENDSEVQIPPYTTKGINHYANGNFRLKDDELPVKISNGYDYTEISMLNSYDLRIYNHTYDKYTLNILNASHKSSKTFEVESYDFSQEITVYSNEFPEIELLKDGEVYTNYTIKNKLISIY